MCIAILQKAGEDRIPKDVLEACAAKNQDGLGIMHPWGEDDDAHVRLWKSADMDKFDEELWNRYTTARDHGLPVGVHFRVSTEGGVNTENSHPFYVRPDTKGMAFMHNGTIRDLGDIPEGVSDTRYFRDEILKDLPGNFLVRTAFYEMVSSFTAGNRLVFMDRNGNYSILHEGAGYWEDKWNAWFSNGQYKESARRHLRPRSTVHTHGQGRVADDDEDDDDDDTVGRRQTRNVGRAGTHRDTVMQRKARDKFGHREQDGGESSQRSKSRSEDKTVLRQCEICQHYVEHTKEKCPLRYLDSLDDIPSELVEDGGMRVDEVESEKVDLMSINWNAVFYYGQITCWTCLDDDYDSDNAYCLPKTDRIEYYCHECGICVDVEG